MERLPLILALSLFGSCAPGSCGGADARTPALGDAPPAEAPPAPVRAALDDLAPATPATEVHVRAEAIRVRNHALVGTWPEPALAAARASAPEGAVDWPRLDETLEAPTAGPTRLPQLEPILSRARRAEASASGSGSGAGVYNLRVDGDVPFAQVQRVLLSASMAGYGAPRLILEGEDGDRMMPWPPAPSEGRLSEDEIAELLAAAGAPAETPAEAPPAPPPTARLELEEERVRAWIGETLQAPGCERDAAEALTLTFDGDAPAEALSRCVARLAARAPRSRLTLAVAPELPFARVAPVLQHGAARFDAVALLGLRPAQRP
ncbi:MAG: hypothetical protein VYE22_27540 [Myxococcota bacterium]|nr:hypothetical protein [Myxococcota bacterium]